MSIMYIRCWSTIACRVECLHQRPYLVSTTTDDAQAHGAENVLVCDSHGTTEWLGLRPANGLTLQWGWVGNTNIKILLQTSCGLLSIWNIGQQFLKVYSDTDKQLSTLSFRLKVSKQPEQSSTAITRNNMWLRGSHLAKYGGGLWHNTHTINKVDMVQCAGT